MKGTQCHIHTRIVVYEGNPVPYTHDTYTSYIYTRYVYTIHIHAMYIVVFQGKLEAYRICIVDTYTHDTYTLYTYMMHMHDAYTHDTYRRV